MMLITNLLYLPYMNEYRDVAVDLARQAGEIMRQNFAIGMKKDWKDDNTPLTITDTRINTLVIETILKKFPTHGVLGEEECSKDFEKAEYIWVCDPLDGTIPFSHGYPTFAFSLALTKNGESILGVVYDPMMDRLLIAEKGKGTIMDGKKITVSKTDTFRQSLVSTHSDSRLGPMRTNLIAQKAWAITFNSAVYGGMLVACGEFVAEIYDYRKPWDGAALKIIVEEAGGKVTDLLGNEQRYDGPINGFIASNGVLHDKLVALATEVLNSNS